MHVAERTALSAGAQVLGALPAHLGQFRIAQRWWRWRRPAHLVLRQRLTGGPELLLDLGDRTQALTYLTRRYSPRIVAAIVSRMPATGGLFVDGGANAGLVTFQVLHRRPGARIVAFEPNPAAAAAWRRNRALNPAGAVELEPAALSDAPGQVFMTAPEDDLGGGHVVPRGSVAAEAVTLDDHCARRGIERIDVLKLDVQGFESKVLDGARGLLAARAIHAVVVEVDEPSLTANGTSSEELLARLHVHGLRPAEPIGGDDVVYALPR